MPPSSSRMRSVQQARAASSIAIFTCGHVASSLIQTNQLRQNTGQNQTAAACAAPDAHRVRGRSRTSARSGSACRNGTPRRRGAAARCTCSIATAAAIRRRVSASSSRPSKRCTSHSGTLAPQRCAMRSICGKRVIGRMPGTMLARIPAAAQRSRKRRNTVGIEEELRDGAIRAGVELRLQVVELERRARRFGMHLRDTSRRKSRSRRPTSIPSPDRPRRRSLADAARTLPSPAADRRAARRCDECRAPSSCVRCRESLRAAHRRRSDAGPPSAASSPGSA